MSNSRAIATSSQPQQPTDLTDMMRSVEKMQPGDKCRFEVDFEVTEDLIQKHVNTRFSPKASYKPQAPTIEGLSARDSLRVWFGPEKSHKSLFAVREAMCKACGKDFHDFRFKPQNPMRGIYFDAENHDGEISQRYQEMLTHFAAAEQQLIDSNLTIIRGRNLYMDGTDITYINRKFWRGIANDYPGEFVYLDALQMLHDGNDSNENLKRVLLTMRGYFPGADMTVLHHTRKRDGKGVQKDPVCMRDVGLRIYSDNINGGGAIKRLADIIIGQELYEIRDSDNNPVDASIDFAAYGRIIEDVPLLEFKESGLYWHDLNRQLKPVVQSSYQKLVNSSVTTWKSRNDVANTLRPMSRSQAHNHVKEMLFKGKLRMKASGEVELV